ncbi:hypothetical protein EVAR_7407_1 [Eumeta japonica]|uniref:Uncharacterized protein n=1 Tax=Eumeta variegata TaxID=151549 RepID=A0A4C1V9G5_EUMVA|nr:hypothetical protein EVAR_7407_1 [Eumeta japonica]
MEVFGPTVPAHRRRTKSGDLIDMPFRTKRHIARRIAGEERFSSGYREWDEAAEMASAQTTDGQVCIVGHRRSQVDDRPLWRPSHRAVVGRRSRAQTEPIVWSNQTVPSWAMSTGELTDQFALTNLSQIKALALCLRAHV